MKWHKVNDDKIPKENKLYLCMVYSPYTKYYHELLCHDNKGWYYYSPDYGDENGHAYVQDVMFWRKLDKPPKELRDEAE